VFRSELLEANKTFTTLDGHVMHAGDLLLGSSLSLPHVSNVMTNSMAFETIDSSIFGSDPDWDCIGDIWTYLAGRATKTRPTPNTKPPPIRSRTTQTRIFQIRDNEPLENIHDGPVLLTQPYAIDAKEFSKIANETFFESLECPEMYITDPSALAVYSYGLKTALVVDMGCRAVRIIPIVEGRVLEPHVLTCTWLSTAHQLKVLKDKIGLEQSFLRFSAPESTAILRDIHERLSFCAGSSDQYLSGLTSLPSRPYSVPSTAGPKLRGDLHRNADMYHVHATQQTQMPELGSARRLSHSNQSLAATFGNAAARLTRVDSKKKQSRDEFNLTPTLTLCTSEYLFRPSTIDAKVDRPSLQQCVLDVIGACPVDYRRALFGNIVLSGGGAMTSGVSQRLENEVQELYARQHEHKLGTSLRSNKGPLIFTRDIQVHKEDECVLSNWVGGSILSGLEDMKNKWVTRESYEENGAERTAALGKTCTTEEEDGDRLTALPSGMFARHGSSRTSLH
jgi:hypothetical protein